MAEDVVIRAEGLGKKYVIGHAAEREGYVALRDVLARGARNLWRKTAGMARGGALVAGDTHEEFWALKDVSFEVRRGEVLGIIGRNGAGKSTLLKILSRITEPTSGRVTIEGRVASLLEVGTGFHPELTGRENIYLNGAILGMSRAEIRRKFDEIVAFAEIEKFLDTPVKRYSSGMYVRLAFAVAAHLEPEILVVDEVLAVGDAEFQKKCLGKMSEVAGGGRTVLFVSHNLGAIEALCSRSLHLASGAVITDGRTEDVIASYLNLRMARGPIAEAALTRIHDGLAIESVKVVPSALRRIDPTEITITFRAETPGEIRECALLIYSLKGVRISVVNSRESGIVPLRHESNRFAIIFHIATLPLVEGTFTLELYLVSDRFVGNILELADFKIDSFPVASGYLSYPAQVRGVVVLNASTSIVCRRQSAMAL